MLDDFGVGETFPQVALASGPSAPVAQCYVYDWVINLDALYTLDITTGDGRLG